MSITPIISQQIQQLTVLLHPKYINSFMFVNETIIEQEAAQLDAATDNYEAAIAQLTAEQPQVLAYLFSDAFKMLTKEERAYFLYLGLVIWKAIWVEHKDIPALDEDTIGRYEERNWEIMDKSSNKKFRERLDVFFEKTPQEDLLAFIEDSLVSDADDQEDFLTTPGREMIFVGLKTIVDVLLPTNNKK